MGRVLIQQDQCPSKKRRLGQGCTQWVKAMWQHSQRQEDASTGRGLAEVAMTAPAPGGRPGIDSPMEPSEGITCWHLDLGLLQSHETLDTVVAHNVCFFVMAAPADYICLDTQRVKTVTNIIHTHQALMVNLVSYPPETLSNHRCILGGRP